MKRYVAVAGTIGAGKTSLVAWLVKRYGLTPFYEPNDENPYLEDFYRDMKAWAFHSQVFFLAHKLKLHQPHAEHAAPQACARAVARQGRDAPFREAKNEGTVRFPKDVPDSGRPCNDPGL